MVKRKTKSRMKRAHEIATLKPAHVVALGVVAEKEPIKLVAVPVSAWKRFVKFMGW